MYGNALCCYLYGSNAMAQPGDGIRVAGSKLVPSVDVYTKYETNPGRLAEGEGPKGDASLVTRLGLDFRKAGADLGLDASTSLVYDYFFGLSDEATKQYSAFSGDFALNVNANKRSEFPIDVKTSILRSADPQIGALDKKLEHTLFGVGLKTGYNPGGGALKNTLSADYGYDYFDRGSSTITKPLPNGKTFHASTPSLSRSISSFLKRAYF